MPDLKTNRKLLDDLKTAGNRHLSPEEIGRQRVSFIMGTLKMSSDVTRERVAQIVAQDEGKARK